MYNEYKSLKKENVDLQYRSISTVSNLNTDDGRSIVTNHEDKLKEEQLFTNRFNFETERKKDTINAENVLTLNKRSVSTIQKTKGREDLPLMNKNNLTLELNECIYP
jgi:hypothetical protein